MNGNQDCAVTGQPTLELGVPDPITFLDFTDLERGGDIPLSSNGQTFLAVQLAIRATNLERFVRIGMTVTYQPETGPARTATKDDSALERLFCRSDERLYLIPIVASSEELGDDRDIQDKTVDVEVTVTDTEGRMVSATANGVLRRI
ncbi:MAG: hypothetical protein MJE77_43285 [Proteobacteria bacterium]|nr:hypothetical protein [Pseudomonadota bacterium]